MIRAIIVDDEHLGRLGIRFLLRSFQDIQLVAECADAQDALALAKMIKPDLVFLDIEMPGIDGLTAVREFTQHAKSVRSIVLVTAHEQYALKAFDAGVTDYLLKPLDDERFAVTIDRVRSAILASHTHDRADKLTGTEQVAKGSTHERIVVRDKNKIFFLSPADVDWVESLGDYVGLHVGKKLHMLRESLTSFEQRLDPRYFLRIHRSTLIQIDRIAQIDSLPNRDSLVTLKNGTRLRASRTYAQALTNALG